MIKVCPCGNAKTVSPFKASGQITWRCSPKCVVKFPPNAGRTSSSNLTPRRVVEAPPQRRKLASF